MKGTKEERKSKTKTKKKKKDKGAKCLLEETNKQTNNNKTAHFFYD